LCEKFGWSREYVDAMDIADVFETIQIVQHREKAFGDDARAHRGH